MLSAALIHDTFKRGRGVQKKVYQVYSEVMGEGVLLKIVFYAIGMFVIFT